MFSVCLKSGLFALATLFLLNCRSAQSAYFQTMRTNTQVSAEVPSPEPLIATDTLPTRLNVADPAVANAAPNDMVPAPPPSIQAKANRHVNPDAQPIRKRTWLSQATLFAPVGDNYTVPRLEIDATVKRGIPKGTIYALAGSTLPYALLLIGNVPTWALLASLTLPVASLFVAMGALTRIRRNKAQFKGKGWAIAAVLLAAGYMGIVLYAAAAISMSGVLWE